MRQLYIDGEWVDADASTGIEVTSPVTGEVLDTVPAANATDVDAAVAAASRAQDELEATTQVTDVINERRSRLT
jgi:acyl-CoA reductase-like NAD-dependent aldehyde dehydrogenase